MSRLKILNDLINLIYPDTCVCCGKALFKHEQNICNLCFIELPQTKFHLIADNPIKKIFEGRFPIVSAGAMYYFYKGGRLQKILHQLKYRGNAELGIFMGKQMGTALLKSNKHQAIDCIIPVPLHPSRLKKRGYNQSEKIAEGISETLGIPVYSTSLIRNSQTQTQTKKSRIDRWLNVEGKFFLNDPSVLENKHVLIVDDVITTGSTLESCCITLKDVPGIKISAYTAAFANER